MDIGMRTLTGIGLLLLTSGTLHAQWYRYESGRLRYMEESRANPRSPGSRLTRDQYLTLERNRQERWLNTVQRRREVETLQRLADDQQAAAQADRDSWQLHDRTLQEDVQGSQTQRQQNRLLHEDRLDRARQQQELRLQERQHQQELRRGGAEPTSQPPTDYRGHGS